MTREQAVRLAAEAGFDHWGIFPVGALRFLPEVRAACEENKCRAYGRSWTCPPACGSLAECAARAKEYDWGILLQTTGQMEDDFDVEVMMEAERVQKERFAAFCEAVGGAEDALPLGAGTCTICAKCTYPEAPCRFPERSHPSMEAFGLQVTDVCQAAEIPYYYGPRTITYSSCALFRQSGAQTAAIQGKES